MSDHFQLAINDLEQGLRAKEDECADSRRAINALCKAAGLPLRYAEVDKKAALFAGPLRRDQYYGKPLASVVREILEARQALNVGPATVSEIYDKMIEGGYVFDGANVDNRKRVLRISLAKNTSTFHKLPGGEYGLMDWYPAARSRRTSAAARAVAELDAEPESDEEGEVGKADVENENVVPAAHDGKTPPRRRRPR